MSSRRLILSSLSQGAGDDEEGQGALERMMAAQAAEMGEEGDDDDEGMLPGVPAGNPLNFMRFHPQFEEVLTIFPARI